MAKKKNADELEVLKKEDTSGRKKALEKALADIESDYGKGAIMRLGNYKMEDVDVISTGAIGIDLALGVGGIPKGRIIEIYGPESSGKTTLTLQIIAEAQKAGGETAFIDAEHALDPIYAKKLGVDIDRLLVSQPNNGEEAMEITEKLIRSSAIDLVVVDSVAALVPQAEIEGNMGDTHVALQARLMSQALRKIAGAMNKTNTTVIFINQLREKVGGYGNPEVTPGGRALKFYSSVRIDIRKGQQIVDGGKPVGNLTRVKVVKNKVAPPFKEVEVEMVYGQGISRMGSLIDTAIEFDIINKAGSWFSYGEEKIGQGREKVKTYLDENPDKAEEIKKKVMDKVKELTGFDKEEAEKEAKAKEKDTKKDVKETKETKETK